MAKRTTEAVLRSEVEEAQEALDRAAELVDRAQATVIAAIARREEAERRRAEAERRWGRAEAALAAYLPQPLVPGVAWSVTRADLSKDVAREDFEDGIAGDLQDGDRIHEPDSTATVYSLAGIPVVADLAADAGMEKP